MKIPDKADVDRIFQEELKRPKFKITTRSKDVFLDDFSKAKCADGSHRDICCAIAKELIVVIDAHTDRQEQVIRQQIHDWIDSVEQKIPADPNAEVYCEVAPRREHEPDKTKLGWELKLKVIVPRVVK